MSKSKRNTDYKAMYSLGIIFTFAGIPITIATRNPAFLGLMAFGIILMLNGYVNRDKWEGAIKKKEFEEMKKGFKKQNGKKN